MTNSFNNTANRPRKNGARSVAVMNERGVNETAKSHYSFLADAKLRERTCAENFSFERRSSP